MRRIFLALCALIFAPTAGVSASIDQFRDLDPSASYGVIWAPVELDEYAEVRAATEEIDDINAFFDMENEGLIVVASITRFDRNQATLVYDGGFETEEVGGPGMQAVRSCFYPIASTVSNEGVSSRTIYPSARKSYDVEYAPKCPSYPCNRTAKGWTGLNMPGVSTDFFWRSNWNAFNYWTTKNTTGLGWGWSVTLYSGDRTINYMERSCTSENSHIYLSWQ